MAEQEILLEETTMIVSETDEKGRILYANGDFCKICGYTKDELIGQPHNMVRHPFMPKVAFEGLWSDLKAGKDWHGIVKNRTKDNNYYWVRAHAYRVEKNGETRYISVRTKPTDREVKDAIKLYKTLNKG